MAKNLHDDGAGDLPGLPVTLAMIVSVILVLVGLVALIGWLAR